MKYKNYRKIYKETYELLSNVNSYSLDRYQRRAIIDDSNAILLVAGAGSGKSLTMIGKIRYLVEYKKILPSEILCLSFTRESSKSLEKSINKNYNYDIKVFTFHSLALNILKGKKYRICPNNLLNYIVDEYFDCLIYNNYEMISFVKMYLGKIDTPYYILKKSYEFINFKNLIITFVNLFKNNNKSFEDFLKIKKDKKIISIIIDIYYLYYEELKSNNMVDYNDLINYSIKYVKNIKYKYIIVDEYQDTSYSRYLLLKSIIEYTGSKIICVGDDYQSIYRFTGCDVNMFLKFKSMFIDSKILKLKNTYRNSQELINVASKFILKNKSQIYKKLKSNKKLLKPINIVKSISIYKLLDILITKYDDILILGRNNSDINKYFKCNDNIILYKDKTIRYLTVHKSKGLESDVVIIINLVDNVLGFPNKIIDNKILKYANNYKELYPFDEERRLFYVALTRTKNEVYLMYEKSNQSIFLKEIIKDNKKYIEYM